MASGTWLLLLLVAGVAQAQEQQLPAPQLPAQPMFYHSFLRRDGNILKQVCSSEEDVHNWLYCPATRELVCLRHEQLCDSIHDCPGGQDEDETVCLFHHVMTAKFDVVTKTLANFGQNLIQYLHSRMDDFRADHSRTDHRQKSIHDRLAEFYSLRHRPDLPTLENLLSATAFQPLDNTNLDSTVRLLSANDPDKLEEAAGTPLIHNEFNN